MIDSYALSSVALIEIEKPEEEFAVPAGDTHWPTPKPMPVITGGAQSQLIAMQWGLPAYDKGKYTHCVPAIAREQLTISTQWRGLFGRSRCLIVADSFSLAIGSASGGTVRQFCADQPFCMAGLHHYPLRRGLVGTASFALITTAAAGVVAAYSDRMPVIIPPAAFAAWLKSPEWETIVALAAGRPGGAGLRLGTAPADAEEQLADKEDAPLAY